MSTEHSQDTDSGIISGHTSRTTTPEQRVQLNKSSTESASIPSIAVTSMGGQVSYVKYVLQSQHYQMSDLDEVDDDFEELYSKRHPNQMLGSRSSLADSRESIYSVYSDAGEMNSGRVTVTGEIMFYMTYCNKTSTLEVHVKQCRDLAPVDIKHNRSDPYVKTYLLPDKSRSSKRKTRIKKHTLNPVFDEILKYPVSSADLASRSLWLSVCHNDRLGRNDFLGEVTVPLDYYRFDENTPQWFPLQERTTSQEPIMFYKGDLLIALKYVPADMVEAAPRKKSKPLSKRVKEREKPESVLGELHVLVREAENLTAMRGSAGSNPFCKGYLLPDTSRSSKQKTPVIRKTTNPEWQHMLVFGGVDQAELHERGLELTVWDHDKLSSNDFLGGVRLNLGHGLHQGKPVDWMDARGEEIEAWQSMIDQPNEWIDVQLPLRASMGKRNV
ncbi:unnamed protein product [Candidula unifasciata]|uniref:C2 domain-containing protein n=1 Tax=Candidula unifasciata TaxID=100452 RepID=A0A8S3ZAV3_9EUPU|nr:unnamed protein product [Candidula unifasciata]